MAKVLECPCGFTAGGPDSSVEELGDIAVVHLKTNHPERIEEAGGEDAVRAATPQFVREVAEEGS